MDTKTLIENTVKDLVADFLYYDRKEDDVLYRGVIEDSIKNGVLSQAEIIDIFTKELNKGLQ